MILRRRPPGDVAVRSCKFQMVWRPWPPKHNSVAAIMILESIKDIKAEAIPIEGDQCFRSSVGRATRRVGKLAITTFYAPTSFTANNSRLPFGRLMDVPQ